jgi:hypothetical protein
MATLNFSLTGESINASKLESKVRKFELEFDNPAYTELKTRTTFSVEYFYSINKYAENLSEAIHLAAEELGVNIDRLGISITGNVDSGKSYGARNAEGGLFNKIDVSVVIVAAATDEVLDNVLNFARELNPVDAAILSKVQFNFSINSIVHLN